MTALSPRVPTVPNPCCIRYTPCKVRGRATVGPPEDLDGCVNRIVTCVKCQRSMLFSENTERQP